jgi:DNA-binding transcriptional LysR family regulator
MPWDLRLKRRLKLRDLDTLLAVAQCGSMAKAAAHLSVSQPAVSKAIADMEATIGVRLFERTAQGVELTMYGRVLLKSGVAIFDDLDKVSRKSGSSQIPHRENCELEPPNQ